MVVEKQDDGSAEISKEISDSSTSKPESSESERVRVDSPEQSDTSTNHKFVDSEAPEFQSEQQNPDINTPGEKSLEDDADFPNNNTLMLLSDVCTTRLVAEAMPKVAATKPKASVKAKAPGKAATKAPGRAKSKAKADTDATSKNKIAAKPESEVMEKLEP